MTDHQEPTKYMVIAVDDDDYPSDYRRAVRGANLPPLQTYPCHSLREAVYSATVNAEQGIEVIVCCTDKARRAFDLPDTIRGMDAVAMHPATQHDTLVTLAEQVDRENGMVQP